MTQSPTIPTRAAGIPWWVYVLSITAIALVLRLCVFGNLYYSPFFAFLMGDAEGYDLWAQRIAAGDWMGGGQVFYQAPAYPYFLAVVYKLFGHSPMTVRVIQCILGALSVGMLAHAGRLFFGRIAGLFAGLLYAFYPIAIFYDLTLQKSSLDGLFMPGLLLALAGLYARSQAGKGGAGAWVFAGLTGLASGLLILTRENALALVPVLLVAIIWFAWPLGVNKRFTLPAAFFAILALTLAPVAVRNHSVSGEWVLTTSQAGPNFYIGNHPGADGSYQPLRPGRGSYRYERTDAIELAQAATGKPLTASEVSQYWMGQSLDYIKSQPGDWLGLMGRKVALAFNSLEAGDTEDPYTYADSSWVLWLTLACLNMGTLTGLAVIALITPGGRAKPVYAIGAIVLTFGASVIAFYVFGRYRFPMAPGLALLAGFGISRVLDLLALWLAAEPAPGQARARLTLLVATTGFFVVYVFSSIPMLNKDVIKAVSYNNIGKELLEQKKAPAEAIVMLDKALTLNPSYAQAYSNLGAALEQTQGPAAAVPAFAKAMELAPELTIARRNLARALINAGQPAQALEVLSTGPADADLISLSAKAYGRLNKHELALAAMERAATLAPNNPDIFNTLGITQAQNGRIDLAERSFAKAVALNPKHSNARVNRARALMALRRPDDAFMELKEHLANYPDDQNAQDLLKQITTPGKP